MSEFSDLVDSLRYVRTPVLNDGFVALVDVMGEESAVIDAARTSYQKGTKIVSDDITLLRYLMEHRHTTPFEMVELKFFIRCPMDAWRQWIRHRTASVNEYSTRYSEAIDSKAKTSEWRGQATVNKQGSNGTISDAWPEGYSVKKSMDSETVWTVYRSNNCVATFDHEPTPAEYLTYRETYHHLKDDDLYQERLKFGVAKEQARKDLPLSTYTEAYWKIDLHNLIHFLGLRMDSHAQLEIRLFANAIGEIVSKLYPNIWEAFQDFRMNAISFAGDEVEYIRTGVTPKYWSKRRATNFETKCALLGIKPKEEKTLENTVFSSVLASVNPL